MRTLNPFRGEFYREALEMSRLTREMYCLMETRHAPPFDPISGDVWQIKKPVELEKLIVVFAKSR